MVGAGNKGARSAKRWPPSAASQVPVAAGGAPHRVAVALSGPSVSLGPAGQVAVYPGPTHSLAESSLGLTSHSHRTHTMQGHYSRPPTSDGFFGRKCSTLQGASRYKMDQQTQIVSKGGSRWYRYRIAIEDS